LCGPEGGLLTTGILGALFFYLHKAPIEQQPALLLQEAPPSIDADVERSGNPSLDSR
jgi:hypothetical protein